MAAQLPKGEALSPVIGKQHRRNPVTRSGDDTQRSEFRGPAGAEMLVNCFSQRFTVQRARLFPHNVALPVQEEGRRQIAGAETPVPCRLCNLRSEAGVPRILRLQSRVSLRPPGGARRRFPGGEPRPPEKPRSSAGPGPKLRPGQSGADPSGGRRSAPGNSR